MLRVSGGLSEQSFGRFVIYIWDSFHLEVKNKCVLGLNDSGTTQIVPWNLDIKDVILKQNTFFNRKPFIQTRFYSCLIQFYWQN